MFIAGIVHNHIFQGLKKLSERENDKKSYTVPAAISGKRTIASTP